MIILPPNATPPSAYIADATLTVEDLNNGFVTNIGATDHVTLTTPSADEIVAALDGRSDRFQLTVIENNAATVTLAPGAGVTLAGDGTVNTGCRNPFVFQVTADGVTVT